MSCKTIWMEQTTAETILWYVHDEIEEEEEKIRFSLKKNGEK